MLKFNNTHIFTGYLKQLLSKVYIPTCKVYTSSYGDYLARTGEEDPKIIRSFEYITNDKGEKAPRAAQRTLYLKNAQPYCLMYPQGWVRQSSMQYDHTKYIPGFTKNFQDSGPEYNQRTHEYLGDFLRFIRDFYNMNLMSMYNCFNDQVVRYMYVNRSIVQSELKKTSNNENQMIQTKRLITFDAKDPKYKIYAIPVKLFSNYTIAIDSDHGIEMFCGLSQSNDMPILSTPEISLINKTYQKVTRCSFHNPILYTRLNDKNWLYATHQPNEKNCTHMESTWDFESWKAAQFNVEQELTAGDVINREYCLRLYLKVPANCKSSIVVLEGDYRHHNDTTYRPIIRTSNSDYSTRLDWLYTTNRSIVNFESTTSDTLNQAFLNPISKLQLLATNDGMSYPFADRLIEYLSGGVISPIDGIPDNIRRAQKVMNANNSYFLINGGWEPKMQRLAYNYMMNEGPFEIKNLKVNKKGDPVDYNWVITDQGKAKDSDCYTIGKHPLLGYNQKSTMFDILGFIDADIEKYYANWRLKNKKDAPTNKLIVKDTIQNADIYDGLWDL